MDLLRKAVDQCKLSDPSGPVAEEARQFLASSELGKVRFRSKAPQRQPEAVGAGTLAQRGSSGKPSRAKSPRPKGRRRVPTPVITHR